MSATQERRLARLRARFYHKALEFADLGFLLKGTLLQRFKRCSSPGCACHDDAPRLHGPYWQWTAKLHGKTVTRVLSDEQVDRYREWMGNAQRFEDIAGELFELSAQADEMLRDLERQAAPAQTKATRAKTPRRSPRS